MILRLNVEAPVELTHGLLGLRAGDGTFHVVNVASLAAFYPMPYKATYAASKRFLLDFSLALREELRGQGVTVTTVCPAGMPTTPECIAAIEAQGLMGQLTTLNTGSVAARTLDAAVAGRPVYIPGALNRFLCALDSLSRGPGSPGQSTGGGAPPIAPRPGANRPAVLPRFLRRRGREAPQS